MHYLITASFVLSVLSFVRGQGGSFNLGARNSALAEASITLDDAHSLFNNVGGIARLENHSFIATYQNRYNIPEFQVVGTGIIYTSSIGNAGIGFYKFGDDLFHQQRIHLALGNQFDRVSLGVGLGINQYHVSTVGTQHVLVLQFGGIAEITPQLLFGAHVFNLNQAKIVEETDEQVPTVMKTGISYRPTKEVIINIEVEKDLDYDEVIRAGVEYQVVKKVFIRTGVSTNPSVNAFGVGFNPKNLAFDYAYRNDVNLGAIHELSFTYSISK